MYYSSGIFDDHMCCTDQGMYIVYVCLYVYYACLYIEYTLVHAVLLVGFGHDDKLHMDYWIIKNR